MSDTSKLIRTDFSSDATWQDIVRIATTENQDGFAAYFTPVDDRSNDSRTVRDIASQFAQEPIIYVADAFTMQSDKHAILVFDPEMEVQFRVAAKDAWIAENNLSIGNMLAEEMVEMVDEDGVLLPMDQLGA